MRLLNIFITAACALTTTLAAHAQTLRIAVTDTGPGISKANLHMLFGQYVQFNPSKLQKGGGSGLGLWISKSKCVYFSVTC